MPSRPDLSIVIPAYNEETRIVPTLRSIVEFMNGSEFKFEIIVVDDGSQDKTAKMADELLQGFPHRILMNGVNRGKGYSVKQGMLAAEGRAVLFSDADLSTPIQEVAKLREALHKGHDVAIGSRSSDTSEVTIHQNFLRELMGKIFNLIARAFSFNGIKDSQCGFKMFTREAAQNIFFRQKINGFCFDAEIIYLAQKAGYKIREVGVIWRNSPDSKVRIIRDSFGMFIDLIRIRFLHFGEKFR